MARYNPPEPGRRPLTDVLEPAPTCHLCQWAYQMRRNLFGLKFISARCALHRALPHIQAPTGWVI